ncbi:sterol desaturase family protein [Parasphingorhabdus sp.]|uniref:sterol desaturase family protein n=1 Tax=Parasphingorhabdus sp. TaxID=2709688 RepID=UPI00359358D7
MADLLVQLSFAASAAAVFIFDAFGTLFSRFHWVSLLSAILLAYFCWLHQRREDEHVRAVHFLAFLFPRKIWLHRSALLDYRFVLFDKVMLGLVIGLAGLVSHWAWDAPTASEPSFAFGNSQPGLGMLAAYTAVLLIVEDFLRYWAHRLMHQSPLLWQFHKVHHSPEVLVPLSQMRTHPVNGIINLIRSGLAVAIVTSAFLLAFPGELTVISILGVNAGRLLFDIMGSNLRHSHVWLSFGPTLSRIFISPAQHQIHHSKAPEHRNRNYGSQFAVWDWMFGSLYLPERRETLTLGIDKSSTERMRSVKSLYLEPFRDAARIWRRRAYGTRLASLIEID